MLRPPTRFLACLLACAWSTQLVAALPTITSLSVRGLQVGGTTRVVIGGTNLLPAPRVVAGIEIAGQVIVGKPAANAVTLDITLADGVDPGVYHLRVASGQGLSIPQLVTVDRLPQQPLEAGVRIEKLPMALHGRLAGSQVGTVQFAGSRGQSVVIDLLARRVGSTLRPVLHLHRSDGRRVALGMPRVDLAGDARIAAKLPADDLYTLRWHDLQYAAGNPGNYRLSIGRFDAADLVFPAAVTRGQAREVIVLGTGTKETRVEVTVPRGARGLVATRWPASGLPVGLRPRVQASRWPEVVETSAESRKLDSVPSAGNGRLMAAGESDGWRVPVKPGEKLRFEVFADRLGSPLDSMLEIRKPDGAVLASNDDAARSDSRLDFTVPAGLSHVLASLSDRHGRGGRRFVYRLVVTRTTDPAPPDFDLIVAANSYNVLPGGWHVFRVDVTRRGYTGAIRLQAVGAPGRFRLATTSIPAGAPGALVMVVSPPGVGGDGTNRPDRFRLVGVSEAEGTSIRRPVQVASHPLATTQPWLREDLAVGHMAAPSPIVFVTAKPIPLGALWQGQEIAVPLQLTRAPDAIGPVRLSLLTSQKVPLAKGKPNAAAAIRGTAATIDIPVPAPVKAAQAAVTKAQAALSALKKKAATAGQPDEALKKQLEKAGADQAAKLKTLEAAVAAQPREAIYRVTVPPGLPLVDYDLAVVAELRSADNKTALARSFSTVLRLKARRSLEIAPRADRVVRASRTPKSDVTVRLRGELLRRGGFSGEITVTVAGQPKGVPAAKVVVKPGQTRFELPLVVPAKVTAARFDKLKLVASGPPNSKTPKIQVSASQEFSLEFANNGPSEPPPPPVARSLE